MNAPPIGDPLQGIPLITGVKPGNQERVGIGVIPSVSFGIFAARPAIPGNRY